MTDNKMQPNPKDRPERAKSEQANPEESEEHVLQGQSGPPAQPARRGTPGRAPLFRH